jgi:hypothetical protein
MEAARRPSGPRVLRCLRWTRHRLLLVHGCRGHHPVRGGRRSPEHPAMGSGGSGGRRETRKHVQEGLPSFPREASVNHDVCAHDAMASSAASKTVAGATSQALPIVEPTHLVIGCETPLARRLTMARGTAAIPGLCPPCTGETRPKCRCVHRGRRLLAGRGSQRRLAPP